MPFNVYKITNAIDGRAYIGATVKALARRWSEHVWAARDMPHPLACAMRELGVAHFTIELLYEASSQEEAHAVERGLICAHGTLIPHGYNHALGGAGPTGVSFPGEASSRAVITDEIVRFIRDPANSGITNGDMVAAVAERFGLSVSRDCLRDARRGDTWRNLNKVCPPIKIGQGARVSERRRAASRTNINLPHVRAANAAASSARMKGTKIAAKLTPDQVRSIRADPRSHSAIAPDYGVSRSTITVIKANKVWLDA